MGVNEAEGLPPYADFQFDNCGREYKNSFLLAYACVLILKGYFKVHNALLYLILKDIHIQTLMHFLA